MSSPFQAYAEEAVSKDPTMALDDMNVRFELLKKFMELPRAKQEEYEKLVKVQKDEASPQDRICRQPVRSMDRTQLA